MVVGAAHRPVNEAAASTKVELLGLQQGTEVPATLRGLLQRLEPSSRKARLPGYFIRAQRPGTCSESGGTPRYSSKLDVCTLRKDSSSSLQEKGRGPGGRMCRRERVLAEAVLGAVRLCVSE